jgi:hypothetical protein
MSRPDIPVTISGDPRGFESALTRLRTASKTTVADIAGSFGRLKSAVAGPIGLLAGLSAGGAVSAVRDTARAIAEVGDEARKAGLGVESFQELKFVAEQNRVGVDALVDGIKELNLRADEFIVTGGGSAAESFKRLGYGAAELKEKLRDPSNLLAEIIGRVQSLDRAAQIRIFDELFGGTGGEQFVQLIRLGEKGIRDTIKAGRDLGVVMDEELIQKASEIDRKFNLLATAVGAKLKSAIIEAADALSQFMGLFDRIDQRQTSHLKDQLRLAETSLRQSQEAKGRNGGIFDGVADKQIARAQAEVDRLRGELNRRDGLLATPAAGAAPKGDRLPSATDILRQKLIDERIKGAFDAPTASSSSRSSSAKAAKEEKSAYGDVVTSLREELELIGKSEVEREKLVALRQAGVSAASDEGQEILKLIDLKDREQKAEDAVTDARERAQEVAERLGQTLDDQLSRIIDGTFDARDAIAALLQEMLNATTQGKGLFGSIFSAIAGGGGFDLFGGSKQSSFVPNTTLGAVLGYGGARAGGGDVSPGRIYRVNEYEDEFFAPSQHGRVYAPSKMQGLASDPRESRSVVEIRLGEGLVGTILQQSQDQSVQLIRSNNEAQANYRQNGGD